MTEEMDVWIVRWTPPNAHTQVALGTVLARSWEAARLRALVKFPRCDDPTRYIVLRLSDADPVLAYEAGRNEGRNRARKERDMKTYRVVSFKGRSAGMPNEDHWGPFASREAAERCAITLAARPDIGSVRIEAVEVEDETG